MDRQGQRIASYPHAPRRPRTLFRPSREWLQTAALLIIAAILLFGTLHQAKSFAIPTVLALLAAVALEPLARRADRLGVPRTLSAAGFVTTGILITVGLVYYLLPSAEAWNTRWPEVLEKFDRVMQSLQRGFSRTFEKKEEESEAEEGSGSGGDDEAEGEADSDPIEQLADSGQEMLTDLVISAPSLVAGLLYAAILTFFMLKERGLIARLATSMGSTQGQRLVLARSMRDIQQRVSTYLLTISIINLCLGLVAAAAFWAVGLPTPLLWGLLVAALNFMPYIGPAIMAVVVFGVGLVTYPDPAMALMPVLVVILLNAVEGQLVTPLLVGQRMQMSALSVFVAITFGAWLWGPAGAILATPVLIVLTAFTRRMWPPKHRPLLSGAREGQPELSRHSRSANPD